MIVDDAQITEQGALPIHMGEQTDFERIFLLYHAPLRYFCEQITGADEACEDIVSQLFLTLWQKQVQFQNNAHAQNYLYRSAKNACLNFKRTNQRATDRNEHIGHESITTTASHQEAFIKAEVLAELYRAIASLPPQCCKVITLSYLEGMSNQEIADELGLPVETIKTYRKRALALLRSKIPGNLFALLTAFALLK